MFGELFARLDKSTGKIEVVEKEGEGDNNPLSAEKVLKGVSGETVKEAVLTLEDELEDLTADIVKESVKAAAK